MKVWYLNTLELQAQDVQLLSVVVRFLLNNTESEASGYLSCLVETKLTTQTLPARG
jgi:hypothetical protein